MIPSWAEFQAATHAIELALHCCHKARVGESITDRLLQIKAELDADRLTREMAEAMAVPR